MRRRGVSGDGVWSDELRRAMPTSSEHQDLVLTSTRPNLQDALAGLLNSLVAHCLPVRPSRCDRTTSVIAQEPDLHTALTALLANVLDTIASHEGGIGAIGVQGVLVAADRCSLWTLACLEEPAPYRTLELVDLKIAQEPGSVSLTATFRTGG